jgi:hypothetical protein
MSPDMSDDPAALGTRPDVVVIPGSSHFDVAPGVLFVAAGQSYSIRNLTRFTVRVQFPTGAVEVPDFTLAPKGNRPDDWKSFRTTATGNGVYEYTVDVALTTDTSFRALGGSNPRIVYD